MGYNVISRILRRMGYNVTLLKVRLNLSHVEFQQTDDTMKIETKMAQPAYPLRVASIF